MLKSSCEIVESDRIDKCEKDGNEYESDAEESEENFHGDVLFDVRVIGDSRKAGTIYEEGNEKWE